MSKKVEFYYEPLATPPKWKQRKRALFKSTITQTHDTLERELVHLGADSAVIQLDVGRGDIRIGGGLRSGAKPKSPAVALAFDSKHGPLTYPCDTFDDWTDNLRAIALALEALRTVDRYGVSGRGEQYTGWARLAAPERPMSRDDALVFLAKLVGNIDLHNPEPAVRAAEMKTHPDRGGDVELFKKVQDARRVLVG